MRVRIIVEALLNKNVYLSNSFLEKTLEEKAENLPRTYALYSDEYLGSNRISGEEVESIFKREIAKITKECSYMGIWQLFSFASVLGCEIFFNLIT